MAKGFIQLVQHFHGYLFIYLYFLDWLYNNLHNKTLGNKIDRQKEYKRVKIN